MLLPKDRQLLTDQQLRKASPDQIKDLIDRISQMLEMRGEGTLMRRPAGDRPMPADPLDPGTIGSE